MGIDKELILILVLLVLNKNRNGVWLSGKVMGFGFVIWRFEFFCFRVYLFFILKLYILK